MHQPLSLPQKQMILAATVSFLHWTKKVDKGHSIAKCIFKVSNWKGTDQYCATVKLKEEVHFLFKL